MTDNRGGKRIGAGRKLAWYGHTVAMRIPEAWAGDIQRCMDSGITPVFDTVQNQQDNVQNQNNNAHNQKDLGNQGCAVSGLNDNVQNQIDIVQNQISDNVKLEALKSWTVYGGAINNPPDILKKLQSAGYDVTESMIKKGAKRTLERWAKHLGLERV